MLYALPIGYLALASSVSAGLLVPGRFAISYPRERQLWMALQAQMRPGVAADEDSLRTMMAALIEIQQEHVDEAREEMATAAEFLTPVQQAQLMLAVRRLQSQIEGARGRHRGQPGMQ